LWEKRLATVAMIRMQSRLLMGGIERAQLTPAQHGELRPQPVVMRTDAKAPAKPACHFMKHPLPLNATRYCPALWQEFENFRSLSDHSRMVLPLCATRHKLSIQTYKDREGRQIATLFERVS